MAASLLISSAESNVPAYLNIKYVPESLFDFIGAPVPASARMTLMLQQSSFTNRANRRATLPSFIQAVDTMTTIRKPFLSMTTWY